MYKPFKKNNSFPLTVEAWMQQHFIQFHLCCSLQQMAQLSSYTAISWWYPTVHACFYLCVLIPMSMTMLCHPILKYVISPPGVHTQTSHCNLLFSLWPSSSLSSFSLSLKGDLTEHKVTDDKQKNGLVSLSQTSCVYTWLRQPGHRQEVRV